jgi:raffinose/stachyose/melibiose transport system permease protein
MFNLSYKAQRYVILFSFLIPPLILLLTFSYYPAFNLLYYSFTDWNGLSLEKNWVGLANYKEIFSNSEVFGVFRNNMYYFVGGLLQTALALYFAVLLNSKLKGRYFFRIILFLPYILHGVAIVYMFQNMYHTQNGALNLLFEAMGLEFLQQNWLGNRTLVDYSLAFISVWNFMGLSVVIFLGALQSIPDDLYEAAKIDGASNFQSFRFITLPSIKIVIELMLILTLNGALSSFEIPFVMTKGANDTHTFVTKTVDVAFRYNNFGLASAMAIVLLAIIAVMIIIQKKYVTKGES